MTTAKFKEFPLRDGKHRVVLYEGGNIWFKTPDGEHFTSAAELAYCLQEYQKTFGGIPVKIEPSLWRGIEGEPS